MKLIALVVQVLERLERPASVNEIQKTLAEVGVTRAKDTLWKALRREELKVKRKVHCAFWKTEYRQSGTWYTKYYAAGNKPNATLKVKELVKLRKAAQVKPEKSQRPKREVTQKERERLDAYNARRREKRRLDRELRIPKVEAKPMPDIEAQTVKLAVQNSENVLWRGLL